jgi:molecular chaperone DnaK
MHISATDKATGKKNNITIKSDSGVSEEEIKRMIRDAEENAESDMKAKTLIEARNGAESQMNSIQKDFDELKDQLTDEDKSAIESALTDLKEATNGDDAEKINELVQKLFETSAPLVSKKQEAEQPVQADNNDQTVDGEFTEV